MLMKMRRTMVQLLIGMVYWQLPLEGSGVHDRLGALFFICVAQTFGNVMINTTVFPDQKLIIKRERAAGTCRASSAFLAKFVAKLPLSLTSSLILSLGVYYMVGLQSKFENFATFFGINIVHCIASSALGLLIGASVPNASVGQVIGAFVVAIMLLFGGQLVNLSNIPAAFKWIQYFAIISHSNKAFSQNEFNGLQFTCPANSTQCIPRTGESILTEAGLNDISMWGAVGINVALIRASLIAGFVMLSITSRPPTQLKTYENEDTAE